VSGFRVDAADSKTSEASAGGVRSPLQVNLRCQLVKLLAVPLVTCEHRVIKYKNNDKNNKDNDNNDNNNNIKALVV
jgi:hypothetical protein